MATFLCGRAGDKEGIISQIVEWYNKDYDFEEVKLEPPSES
jgi:hypothetical protein